MIVLHVWNVFVGNEEIVIKSLAVKMWSLLVQTTGIKSSTIKDLPKESFFASLMSKITGVQHAISSIRETVWSQVASIFKFNCKSPTAEGDSNDGYNVDHLDENKPCSAQSTIV